MPPPACSSGRRILLIHHLRRCISLIQYRTFIDARIQWVRDRGLDHAVEKEKHLLPFHSLKDFLLNSLPSSSSSSAAAGSIPLDSIADRRQDLSLPFRAIRFIRLFPNAFVEEAPNLPASPSDPSRPSIRPTEALIRIHSEELSAIQSSRTDAADRLLRLLMLSPYRRLPLPLIDRLRWDLGLPCDFVRSLLPDFPDYFQISPSPARNSLDIELVCYRKDLAISALEHYAMRTGEYRKSTPLAFPLHFSRGFELEKKVRKWLDEWQKLPYISPYESGSNLPPKSDLMEKWIVGALHEVLNLLIGKKTAKENLIILGKHLGLPSEFRKVISHHPGIFYLSNKLKMQTVVLREAYRRDLLIEKHPMMGIRYQYIHLMHKNMIGSGKKKRDQKSRRNARSVEGFDGGDGDDHVVEDGGLGDGVEVKNDSDDELSEVSDFESEDDESDEDDEVIDTNLSRTREIQPRRLSPIRASPIERKLRTSKTRRDEMHRVGRRNSMGENMRAPPRSRIST
ncbi:hypothetical protein KSP40_PGU003245 [Platanthera guangdongensis]|uniref:PORR domain-containing protein n=1 Tax=Platanthera guangdongensis TaxID=2320717 RepID=A0ABR2MG92_9ASPA